MTENVRKKPSREKFVEFCAKRLHVTREDITEAIWEKCESVKWLKKKRRRTSKLAASRSNLW